MNNRQKLVQQQFLNNEEIILKKLRQTYGQSQKDIIDKISNLQFTIDRLQVEYDWLDDDDPKKAKIKSQIQSKIYQKQHQNALKGQVDKILNDLQKNAYESISDYLAQSYDDGFIGTMFDLQGQGVPLCMPLDQEAMIRAVQTDSKISKGLYSRMGEDVALLKNNITDQVSRGISTGMSFEQVAQQISFKMTGTKYKDGGALARAMTIARTEGHRIQIQAGMDACYKAKEKGADVVKQWDSTMDGATRPSHQRVEGEIRELDEPFSNGLMFPGDPSGGAAEVINCRCALLQRARWALDEEEIVKMDNNSGELIKIKAKNYDEFKKQYFEEASKLEKTKFVSKTDSEQFERYKAVLGNNAPKTIEKFIDIKQYRKDEWSSLKRQYRTVNRYEIDGKVTADKILELDKVAYDCKKNGFDYSAFVGKEKRRIKNDISNCGNVASMEFDGKIYFSHSKFGLSGSFEHGLYGGGYPAVTLSENRIFDVLDLGDNIPRQYDTEAKFLEFVASQKKVDDKFSVTILSEKHICESCQHVVEQFKQMFPNSTVNIVSGKQEYNNSAKGLRTWKYRK